MMHREETVADVPARFRPLTTIAVFAAALLWSVWPSLGKMAECWSSDPRYSHGFLVPLFAVYLLWLRRDMVVPATPRAVWWGVLAVAAGAALRFAGDRFYLPWVEQVTLLPWLAGTCLILGGWGALKWAAPAIAFLVFMIPLPYRVEHAVGYPLQRVATLASGYALQTLGLPAVAEGNVILLNDSRIGVVEACNGLGMLFMFFAISFAWAMVVRRSLLEKCLIVLSAIPTALAANVARITLTGLMHEVAGSRVADVVYHDLAGWLMMPMALAALWAELWLLSKLIVEREAEVPVVVGLGSFNSPARPRPREVR
jgi:exosortase